EAPCLFIGQPEHSGPCLGVGPCPALPDEVPAPEGDADGHDPLNKAGLEVGSNACDDADEHQRLPSDRAANAPASAMTIAGMRMAAISRMSGGTAWMVKFVPNNGLMMLTAKIAAH